LSVDKNESVLEWYYLVLFAVVTLVALSMTWWSMFDLGVRVLSVPVLFASGLSLTFDLGGVYLGILSIKYARTTDSGFWTELGAFGFIGTSTYIVAQHAILLSYPTAGVVLFASAPVIVGIMLKATLNFLTRQARKQAGRVTEKLPSVGWLTWIRYRKQTWKLMSVAMQGRLVNAADKLDIREDRHAIFVSSVQAPQTIVEKTSDIVLPSVQEVSETKPQLSQPVSRPVLTTSDKVSLPVWLPHEPTMSLGKLSRTCLDNGVLDIETVYRYAVLLKGQNVNKTSLSRTLYREKTKQS
jgi:hypothetical protein